ncbi:hypothetical protein HK104_006396 [Borealophlyctis nickersoniae]|nr:hypothetical protein HK104_006396 [Borealophlyctis nickersoniae]
MIIEIWTLQYTIRAYSIELREICKAEREDREHDDDVHVEDSPVCPRCKLAFYMGCVATMLSRKGGSCYKLRLKTAIATIDDLVITIPDGDDNEVVYIEGDYGGKVLGYKERMEAALAEDGPQGGGRVIIERLPVYMPAAGEEVAPAVE